MNILYNLCKEVKWIGKEDYNLTELTNYTSSKPKQDAFLIKFGTKCPSNAQKLAVIEGFFSEIKPKKNIEGYSLNISTDSEEFNVLTLLQIARGKILFFPKKQPPNLCALVPLGLKYYKDTLGIEYNEWNKEKKAVKLAMLSPDFLVPFTSGGIPRELLEMDYFEAVAGVRARVTAIKETPSVPLIREWLGGHTKPSSQALKIFAQLWNASAEHRTADMILDCEDWSRMPPAYDSSKVASEKRILSYDVIEDV